MYKNLKTPFTAVEIWICTYAQTGVLKLKPWVLPHMDAEVRIKITTRVFKKVYIYIKIIL